MKRRAAEERGAGQRGAAMMFILIMTGVISVVTMGVLFLINAELSASVRQLQAVRVFNVAEAGVHYAMARLQLPGASTYSAETIPITNTDGSVLGTATVSVGCVDGTALPCTGPNAAYRRVVSVGTLPVSGPSRTVVAIVEGYPEGLTGYAICAYDQVLVNQGINIYGDVGSNGNIDLLGPASNAARVRADPPPPYTNLGYYTGSARAVGTVNCSQDCTTQVAGTTTSGAPGPVCPTIAAPTYTPGGSNQTVTTAGWTMDSTTGYSWNDITVNAAGTGTGCTGATPFSDLRIQTGAAGTTTVVQVRRLTMGRCGRLIILGDGKVDLRIGEPTAQGVVVGQYGRFGVLPTDTLAAPAPIAAGRLTISVNSSSMDPAAAQIDRASLVSGAWIVPNGELDLDRLAGQIGEFYGAILARRADIDRDYVFTYDPTAVIGTITYTNYTRLRSWKDQ